MNERERLQVPLGASFDDRLPENRAHRLWERVEAARSRNHRVPLSFAGGLALASAALVMLAVWVLWPASPVAIRLAGGGDVSASLVSSRRRAVAFDDGSEVDLSPKARLDVLESTGRVFGLALREGTSEFEVRPGGPRAWRIECGGVTVEVVGTHFTMERSRESLRVAVTRGAVLVRGDRVPDRVVRLGANQVIVVPLADEGPSALAAAPSPISSVAPVAPVAPSARTAVPAGSTSASPSPPAYTAPSLDVLLGEADAARREAHFVDAARLMEQALAEHPSDPRTAIAEFSLGRLYLDSLGDSGRAAAHFAGAIKGGRLPATLAEDAQARLVEAYRAAGNSAGTSEAAARYRALYPAGRRTADVDRWASSSGR